MKKLFAVCVFLTLCMPAFPQGAENSGKSPKGSDIGPQDFVVSIDSEGVLTIRSVNSVTRSKNFGLSISADVATSLSKGGMSTATEAGIGYTLSASWLFASDPWKLTRSGVGLSFSRELWGENPNFSNLAAYLPVQIYPMRFFGSSFYIKGSVGLNVMISSKIMPGESLFLGTCYGVGIGSDLASGVFAEIIYNNYGFGSLEEHSSMPYSRYETLSCTWGIRF